MTAEVGNLTWQVSYRGPLLGPLGQFLRESVTNRLPGDLKLARLGVTITAKYDQVVPKAVPINGPTHWYH